MPLTEPADNDDNSDNGDIANLPTHQPKPGKRCPSISSDYPTPGSAARF